jgi:hypothetical protein
MTRKPSSDIEGMRRITERVDVVPGVIVDRRRGGDRRALWRGGRRDTDWINRPLDLPVPVDDDERRTSGWRRWLALRYGRRPTG